MLELEFCDDTIHTTTYIQTKAFSGVFKILDPSNLTPEYLESYWAAWQNRLLTDQYLGISHG